MSKFHYPFCWKKPLKITCELYTILFAGSKLFEHQGFAGSYLPNCCWHDQGKNSRRDQEDFQHQERLHPGRGRRGSSGEPVGIRMKVCQSISTAGSIVSNFSIYKYVVCCSDFSSVLLDILWALLKLFKVSSSVFLVCLKELH